MTKTNENAQTNTYNKIGSYNFYS